MARTVNDATLSTRSARARLATRAKPYWRILDHGLHLGYRKGKRAGRWVARLYDDEKRTYVTRTIGTADDIADADGLAVFDFRQAQAAARESRNRYWREAMGEAGLKDYTVADAMEDYLQHLRTFGKSADDANYRIDAFVKPELGDLRCDRLTAKRIRDWFIKLAEQPPRLRSNGEQQYRDFDPSDPEQVRKRRAAANRTLTILKAALNRAYQEGKIASDNAWRRVKPFRDVDAPRIRYLDSEEIKRLRNAAAPDLRRLIDGALLTGCRYGELAAMKVADYHPDSGTVRVATSKTGKPRDVVLTEEGKTFFEELTAGRSGSEAMFKKANGERWGKSHQRRPLKEACQRAKIDPPASFHILRHTYASRLVMAGVPMAVVSENLGHADTRMTERHYTHLAPSYKADVIRKLAPGYGIEASNVKPMRAQ